MLSRVALILLSIVALSGCDRTTSRYASDYASRLSQNEILIVPPYAEAYMLNANGSKERMYDYESHVEPTLSDELQKKLNEMGYHARVMHKSDLMNNGSYKEYGAFKETFITRYTEEYSKGEAIARDKAKNSVITFGGRAKALGDKLGVPVFAYIDYGETARTSAGQTLDFATALAVGMLTGSASSAPPDNAKVIVALIDARQDKLLWVNHGMSAGGGLLAGVVYTDDEQSLQHVRTTINGALHQLPNRDKLFEN